MNARPEAFLGTCKRCKLVIRETGLLERSSHQGAYNRTVYTYRFTKSDGTTKTMHDKAQYAVDCKCSGRHITMEAIVATTTKTPCDERCTHATGHNCNCSCGGKNHGTQA